MNISPLKAGLALALVLSLGACNKKESGPENAPERAENSIEGSAPGGAPPVPRKGNAPDTFRAALGPVFADYLQMQSALASDDLGKAKEAFNALHIRMHTLPVDALDPVQKAEWTRLDAEIMEAVHPTAASGDIEAVREGFATLSKNLIAAAETYGVRTPEPLQVFHCPMARKNQGADWIQSGDKARNPYFGASMAECGAKRRAI